MPKDKFVDFDRFLAEREKRMTTVRIFGRECRVPAELPWHYVMKVDAMLHGGSALSGKDNLAILKQMFAPEDYDFLINHPEFRASYVWELIARTWLRAEDDESADKGPEFKTEDDVKVEKTRAGGAKKGRSAR